MVVENARMLASLNRWDAVGEVAVLHSPPGVRLVATLMTFGTVALEGALAIVFLAPDHVFLARWRHTVLIGFCVVVYFVAPVVGFGCLFLGMGGGAVPARPIAPPPYVCGALFRFAQLGVRSRLHLHGQFGDLTRVIIVGQCPRLYRR